MSMTAKKCVWIFSLAILSLQFLFSQQETKFKDKDCLVCHGKPDIHQILENGLTRSLHVVPEEWEQDVHSLGRMTCVDCHREASPAVHFREGFPKVNCARCHPEEAEEYTQNIHFEYRNVTPGKELPLCYDCHTKHNILLYDNPEASVNEQNIGKTCGRCHAEVMVKGIFKGISLGKISGHRKGDLSEKFDMEVCINCHYKDSAHGAKRPYKEFCQGCHDVRQKGSAIMGPVHLNSTRWAGFNLLGNGLLLLLLLGMIAYAGIRSHRRVFKGLTQWTENMKIEIEEKPEKEDATSDEGAGEDR
ncbi:cytochrome c3 family protein [Acidobacteriota bacterium]